MKILITGGKGQLGRAFAQLANDSHYRGCHFLTYDIEDMNILDNVKVLETITSIKPDAVIHAAAYTQVDKAESEPDSAFALNVVGTQNIAAACLENNIKMAYISTDYVFDGQKKNPYTEFDPPNPQSVYGRTKLMGENIAAKINPRLFIARTAWLYGDGANFVKTMLRLAQENGSVRVVSDQTGTPTYTLDLAKNLMRIIETNRYGTYHMTNNGSTTWYEFAREIFRLANIDAALTPISTEEYPVLAVRPNYSVLENHLLKMTIGDEFRNWQEALAEYLSATP